MYVVDASEFPVTRSVSALTIWTGKEALDVAMRWPTEDTFEYRAYRLVVYHLLALTGRRLPMF